MVESGNGTSATPFLDPVSALRFQEAKPTNLPLHPQPWCGKHVAETDANGKNVYNYALRKTVDKTPMCRIAELARHHKLKHEYVLMDESGPAHKKKFTVKLVLKEGEEYEGSGASIKKAQQSAAENALEKTEIPKPPRKTHKAKNVKLEHEQRVIAKNGPIKHPNVPPPPVNLYNNMPPLNNWSPVVNCTMPLRQHNPVPIKPCALRDFPYIEPPGTFPWGARENFNPNLNPMLSNNYPQCVNFVQDKKLFTNAHLFCQTELLTKALGKLWAMLKTKPPLKPQLSAEEAKLRNVGFEERRDVEAESDEMSGESDEEKSEEEETNEEGTLEVEGTPRKKKLKSVVSQIHEAAFRLKMNVEFEVLTETGEPHNRHYTMRCRLNSPRNAQSLEAEGNGTSKKSAKQSACREMLAKVDGLENDPVYLASMIVKSGGTKKTSNREAKRKTIVKDMKMDPQYGHHINPISRLIQVMQARKQPDPTFRLVGEQGQNRYREFIVEVTSGAQVLTGVGPNKKLAKRAAAEAMLAQIGYVKPMPQPGKSLLKKKSSDSLQTTMEEIGLFDPSELNVEAKPVVEDKKETAHTVQNSPQSEAFAEVDSLVTKELKECCLVEENNLPAVPRVRSDSEKPLESELAPIRSQRRRVTFSTRVAECPPPEDSNYPASSMTLLKSEVVVAPKLKKRGRDSKKALSAQEKATISSACQFFLTYPLAKDTKSGFVRNEDAMMNNHLNSTHIPIQSTTLDFKLFATPLSPHPQHSNDPLPFPSLSRPQEELGPDNSNLAIKDAKWFLERLAKFYKFTVSYSDFPKTSNMNNDSFFSIVTIGLDKTVLLPGTGPDEEQAHIDAAFHGIEALAQVDKP